MKNSELISLLSKYDGDLEITTSDWNGNFTSVNDVELQKWSRGDISYASLTIVLDVYRPQECIISSNDKDNKYSKIVETTDEEDSNFIDNVNNESITKNEIDKEEAFNERDSFKKDIRKLQKKYSDWYYKKYDEVAKQAMILLFGSDKLLNYKTINDLKLHVYENGWQSELGKDELNDRNIILRLLYNKLDDKIKELLSNDKEDVWNEINEEDADNEEEELNKEEDEVDNFLNKLANFNIFGNNGFMHIIKTLGLD